MAHGSIKVDEEGNPGLDLSEVEKDVLRAVREELGRRLPAGTEAYLFGSRARRSHRPDSDYDVICVMPDPPEGERMSLSTYGVMDAVGALVAETDPAAEVNLQLFTEAGFEDAVWETPFLRTAWKEMVSLGSLLCLDGIPLRSP